MWLLDTRSLHDDVSQSFISDFKRAWHRNRSCGTLTVAETDMPGELEMCNKDVFDTVQNWCNTVAYTDSHGKADGELVFVKMDCLTHTLLPMAAQEAPYQYPGVSIGPNH